MQDLFVYLSGPITAKHGYSVEENVASALRIHLELLRRGIPNFCPQLSGGFPSAFEVDYETWIAFDFAVIRRCTHVLLLPRWDTSDGARRERAYADSIGVPTVLHMDALPKRAAAIRPDP